MHALAFIGGIALILLVMVDGFEAVVQPRRVTHRFRPIRLFYRVTWKGWQTVALVFRAPRRHEAFLSIFGPLSLLALFASWVVGLIVGFSLLYWSLETRVFADETAASLATYLYLSGATFFTVGYGDVAPVNNLGRALAVAESGTGLGFIALIIGYFPVLYQAFSQRERTIGLLDARAGSPPTAGELIRRLAQAGRLSAIEGFLQEWERWAGDLLESHLSFPILSYYRSQHDNQSWLAALTAILDTCSLLLAGVKETDAYQAQLTFAMARHAAVDLAMVLWAPPETTPHDRMPPDSLAQVLDILAQSGCHVADRDRTQKRLTELRQMYEPFLYGLSRRLQFSIPPVFSEKAVIDNWQTSAWMNRTPGIGSLPAADDQHFH